MADTITPCQAALWFASQAFPVLPLHGVTEARTCTCGWQPSPDKPGEKHPVGKHPHASLAPHGLKDATAVPSVVRAWFRVHYWLNFGVLTDRFLVIGPVVGRYKRPAYPRCPPHLGRIQWRRRSASPV